MELREIYCKGKEIIASKDYGYLMEGVETGWVLENNRKIMNRFSFKQKSINAPNEASTETNILGAKLKTPVIMSAMTMPIPAMSKNGLLEVSKGLLKAGSMMWTGTPIPQNLAELANQGAHHIQSVKCYRKREKIYTALEKCQEANVNIVSIEIDTGQGTKIFDKAITSDCSPLTLDELRLIRDMTPGKMIFKGVLSVHDAKLSLEAGADAIMISNHGGHTIDYLPHPFQVIAEIHKVIKGKIPIFVDGGFRRGSDVFKALALGADAVGLGRPILYGLATMGKQGVFEVVSQITSELRRIMVMAGYSNIEDITPGCLIDNNCLCSNL